MPNSIPPSGLYIRIAAQADLLETVKTLREIAFVLNRADYEKNMHVIEIEGDETNRENISQLTSLVQAQGLVAILQGPLALAKELGMDGVILPNLSSAAEARQALGNDGIIGVRCDFGRSEAEALIGQDIDYVLFGDKISLPTAELIKWWSAASDISSVISASITNDYAGNYVRSGVTFIDSTDYILKNPQGLKQGTVNMIYAIDLAVKSAPAVLN